MPRLVRYHRHLQYLYHLMNIALSTGLYFLLRLRFSEFISVLEQNNETNVGLFAIVAFPSFLLLELVERRRSLGKNIIVNQDGIETDLKKFSIKKEEVATLTAKIDRSRKEKKYLIII